MFCIESAGVFLVVVARRGQTSARRDEAESEERLTAKIPPLAEAGSLNQNGRSVRAHAALKDEFAKRKRSRWRTENYRRCDWLRDAIFERKQNREHRDDRARRHGRAVFQAVRDHRAECFAALQSLAPIGRLPGRFGIAAMTAGVLLFHLLHARQTAEGAVIGEHEPAEKSHRGDDCAEAAAGADRVQKRDL